MNALALPALLSMVATQALVVLSAFAGPVFGKQVTDSLGVAPELIGYYTSVVFAIAMFSSVLSGPLIERYGPVRVSQATVLIAGIGLLLLNAGSVATVALSALLMGLAYGPGNPASSQLLARTVPPHRRTMMFSVKQTAVPLGVTGAGVALPLLALPFGWQGALLAAAGVCAAVALAVQPWRQRLDTHRSASPRRIGLAAPFRAVLGNPVLRQLALVCFCLACVQFSFSAIFVTYLQEETGAATTTAGPVLSIAMAISVASRVLFGAVADKLGGRTVLIAMGVAMVVSAFTLAGAAGLPFIALATIGIVLGSAAFSWNGIYLAEVAEAAPQDAVAIATAGTMFFVFLGGFAGPALVSSTIAASGSYAAGFLIMGLFAAAGTIGLILKPSTPVMPATLGDPT